MGRPAHVAPDGGWGWVIVFVSFSFHLLIGFLYAAYSILYIALQEHFSEGKGLASWIPSTFNTMLVTLGPLSASLSLKYGYRPVTFVGGFLIGLGTFVSYFANSIPFLIISIGIVAGSGSCLCYVPVIAMCAMYFDKKRSLAVGLGTSGLGVGAFALPPLVTFLEDEYSWRGMLLIISGCMFNMCVLALLMRPLPTVEKTEISQHTDAVLDECVEKEECHYNSERTTISNVGDVLVLDKTMDAAKNEDTLTCDRSLTGVVEQYDKVDYSDSLSTLPSPSVGEPQPLNGVGNSMASELLKRNKYLSIDSERSSSRAFHQRAAISSENISKRSNNRHFYSTQEISKTRGSKMDISKSFSPSCEGKSLTNRSIMLMGSIYNIVPIEPRLNSMLSLTSKKTSIFEDETDYFDVEQDAYYDDDRSSTPAENRSSSCFHRLRVILKNYRDLLKNRNYFLTALSNFLVNLTYLMPVLYLVDRAVENGIERDSAVLALSMYGAGNICGRICTGIIADLPCVNRMLLYFICTCLCGVITCLSVFCDTDLALHTVYGFFFGLFIGGYVILTPVVLVDILGVDMVSQSYGLCLLFMGAATIIGTPMAGWMFDMTGGYIISFVLYGSFLILSSLLLMPLILASFRQTKSIKQTSQDETAPLDSST